MSSNLSRTPMPMIAFLDLLSSIQNAILFINVRTGYCFSKDDSAFLPTTESHAKSSSKRTTTTLAITMRSIKHVGRSLWTITGLGYNGMRSSTSDLAPPVLETSPLHKHQLGSYILSPY